jgi:hypothetical protein
MAADVNYSHGQDGRGVAAQGGFYGDSAELNPDELATFPKQVTTNGYPAHQSHLVSHRTPVRDGVHITRTDNHPTRGGYM